MRPKKKILLIDADRERCSVWAYVLATNGYAVHVAEDAAEAKALAVIASPDLAIAVLPMPGLDGFLDWWRLAACGRAAIVICEEKRASLAEAAQDAFPSLADVTLHSNVPAAELLEQVKVLSARKRGPRKGVSRVEIPFEIANAAERRIA
jgi:DNA-binding response OmpR family regulator